ncbi:hypothetical protein [Burkholderia ubonensis]|uniref:hypothetical protein n=1 Tax=Burkholderia ubonensis TaxID=101571 RepID=UPI000759F709|nr:hypothetical protein [Burkholderia ubonensis]KVX93520.1 hypothetical protein WL08_25515 [Burkholderia ubonensis]
MAIQDGRRTTRDDVHVVWVLLRIFRLCGVVRKLLRRLVLKSELPSPKRAQILIAHSETDERHRGRSVVSVLLDDAMRTGALPSDGGRDGRNLRI